MNLTEKKLTDKIRKIESEKEYLEIKIKKIERELKKFKQNEKDEQRRKRAHHLITVGALLEIACIDKEDKNLLLGYFLRFSRLTENERQSLKIDGIIEFDKRKKMRSDGKK